MWLYERYKYSNEAHKIDVDRASESKSLTNFDFKIFEFIGKL